MRRAAVALVGGLALILVVSCSSGAGGGPGPSAQHSPTGYVPTGKWDAAFVKLQHGVSGSFSSLVIGKPCTEPITKPCVVGGAEISDVGVFATGADRASYVHRAVGLAADATEARGYRTLHLRNGDTFVSAMGRAHRGGCWARTASVPEFGSRWSPMPAGFAVLLNADADNDPKLSSRTTRFGGVADVGLVLLFLGLDHFYYEAADHYGWKLTRVPIELRVDAKGLPTGFAVDGARIAESLVGPAPESTNAPAAFTGDSVDALWDAAVRQTLTPMRGEFSISDLGTAHTFTAPPRNLILHHRARGDDPCPAAR